MSYQVIARKWRPQTFREVVFQEHISRTLQNSITGGRVSHAYLFSGPRGVGKTTMARILSKALNCETGMTPEPCNRCNNCLEITDGSSFDVIEIDGASNRGIEDIRELRENVNFAPVKSRYKVYIIDEVHMLTREAFNALLKTLEEPPPHIVFMFATTEVHQIPETILSRCQKFYFKKIPLEPVVEHLRRIVEKEGLRISDRALYPIARSGGGSMRDAQSLLDQVISFSDQKKGDGPAEISELDALAILGIVPVESYITLARGIADLDAPLLIEEVNRVVSLGVDIPRYAEGFIEILRTLRLIKNGITVQEVLGLSDEEKGELRQTAERFHDEELGLMFRIADELQSSIRYSTNERINLEMALLDMVTAKKTPSIAGIVARLEEEGGGNSQAKTGYGGAAPPAKRGGPANDSREENKPAGPVNDSREETKKGGPVNGPRKEKKQDGARKAGSLEEAWRDFLASISETKKYLHLILQPAKAVFGERSLTITYAEGTDQGYYSRILNQNNIRFIRDEISARMGSEIEVKIGIAQSPAPGSDTPPEEKSPNDMNVPDEAGEIPPPEDEMMKKPEIAGFEKTRPNPTVEKIKELFHGEIIEKGDSK